MGNAFGSYRSVLGDRAARAFSAAGLIARMPLSMTGLGVVLLVSLTTGSYGRAGLVAAVATLTGALAAPLWGRVMDRVGQSRVLLVAVAIWATGLAVLVISVVEHAPLGLTLIGSLLVGSGYSSSGSAVRARWAHRLGSPDLLHTAYAVEAVLDEVVFIVGPVVVTYLCSRWHPAAGLVVSGSLGLVGALLLAGQRRTQPPSQTVDRAVVEHRVAPGFLVPLVVSNACLGAVFGSMEVAVVAYAQRHGVLGWAGIILMTWAVGSLLAGVITGAIRWRATPTRRYHLGATLLAATLVPLVFVPDPVWLAAALAVNGCGIAPTLIASTTVVQQTVPPARLSETLGWASTGLAAGVAGGAALTGHLVDRYGPTAGFVGMLGVGVLLAASVRTVRDSGPVSPIGPGIRAEPHRPAAA